MVVGRGATASGLFTQADSLLEEESLRAKVEVTEGAAAAAAAGRSVVIALCDDNDVSCSNG